MISPGRVQFGIAIPQVLSRPRVETGALQAFLRRAEGLGYHSAWVQEQILGAAYTLEPVTLLTYAAAVTRTLRLGAAVLLTALRNPVQLAKSLSTLDHLSEGRLIVGVGIGGHTRIYPAFGFTAERRVARFAEGLRVMVRLWTEERVTFAGEFCTLEDAAMEPKPLQEPHPPLWFGARVPAALKRTVELGDGFIGAGSSTLAEFTEQVAQLRGYLAAAGRDPSTFPIAKRVYLAVDPDKARGMERMRECYGRYYRNPALADRTALVGDVKECLEALRAVRAAGAGMILLNPLFDEARHLELLAAEILPALA
ncbi:MAG TPA: LLM class flavin-dependent oxidoreductase [Candidatus Methylomirabilis sp.]